MYAKIEIFILNLDREFVLANFLKNGRQNTRFLENFTLL
jgi:hypothetical protein